MSEAKAKRLFAVGVIGAIYTVAASTPAKARKWAAEQIHVSEIGAVEAMGIDKKDVQEAE